MDRAARAPAGIEEIRGVETYDDASLDPGRDLGVDATRLEVTK